MCLLLIFFPIIVIIDSHEITETVKLFLFFFKFIIIVVLPILYGIFYKLKLEIGGKIVLTLISAVPVFFLFVIVAFVSMCRYNTPNIEFSHRQYKRLSITSTQFDCGAYDRGDSQVKYYKTLKLFDSINILYQDIDKSEVDTTQFIKL